MYRSFILIIFLLLNTTVYAQIQKLYNTENPDSNSFGTIVSIWKDFALVQNKDFHGGQPKRKYDLHIFKKDNHAWKEIQAFSPFISFNEYKEKYAVIYENTIITDIFNLHNVASSYHIYILRYKGSKFEYIDSIPVKFYLHHPGLKSIYNNWFMVMASNEIAYASTTYFYQYDNNKWILKDSFNIVGGDARWFKNSIMHKSIALQPALDSIIVFKKKTGKWDIYQKLFLPWQYTWNSSVFKNDISISPNEKWIAGTATDSIGYPNKLTYLMIYKLVNTKWELSQKIRHVADDSLAFGRAVNISDDELLIGAPLTNNGKGTIYYYTLQNDIWVLKGEIKPPPQDTFYGYFGSGIDRFGETVIVGAEKDKTYSYAPGAAYIFQIPARDTLRVAICEGESYTFNDTVITTSGHYVDTLMASYGVDSVVQLYVDVHPTPQVEIDTFICPGDTIKIGEESFTEVGEYEVMLKSEYGCDSIVQLSLGISDIEPDSAIISDYGCGSGAIDLINIENGNNPPYTFDWSTGEHSEDISGLTNGTYSVTIWDKNGCEFPLSFIVPDSIPFLIPNAFFPSGTEEINKHFKIYQAQNVHLESTQIFDRWGEKVYESEGDEYWDGSYKGKPQAPGVYLYKIVIDSPCGKETKTGQVMLLR